MKVRKPLSSEKPSLKVSRRGHKFLTVITSEVGDWYMAICPELMVSGFGSSRKAAIESVTVSIRSTLAYLAKRLGCMAERLTDNPANLKTIARFSQR